MATTSGQVTVIPIILCSLTESLANTDMQDMPITFNDGFISVLDVGTTQA